MLAWHTLQTRGPTWRQLEGKNSFRGNLAKGKVVFFDFRSTLNRQLICLENEPAHHYLTRNIDAKSCCDPLWREEGTRPRSSFMCPVVCQRTSQIRLRIIQAGWSKWVGVAGEHLSCFAFYCRDTNTLTGKQLRRKGLTLFYISLSVHHWGKLGRNTRQDWSKNH